MAVQRTIGHEVSLTGIGLHSGETTNVTCKPAPPDTGIKFIRVDLEKRPSVTAGPQYLCQRARRTALAKGDVEIHTPEHFLAAVTGLGVDNLLVEMDNVEFPGMDGSAIEFVEALRSAEIVPQDKPRKTFTVREPVSVSQGDASIVAMPHHDGLKITYTLDDHNGAFSRPMIVELELTEEGFVETISRARTFCLADEAEMLRAAGLGKGANYQNTCVFDGDQPIETELRYPDEPARHKVLDLIGDLAMAARSLNAHIIAVRSGHHQNMALVKEFNKRIAASERPAYILDVKRILNLLPHRYPFLLVDRIISMEGDDKIIGEKNVSVNEPHFGGHFPGNPVMPGVLLIESIAQTGAVLLMTDPQNDGKVPLFMSVERGKFRRPVRPGDKMIIEVERVRKRRNMHACRGRILVDGQLCAEAEIRSVLVDLADA